ncbi:MAG TPA: hypothetical protein VFU33_01410 [Gaiellaceae bacterium]|nr:hypothetical protein [Gaiellaceae bacterium]
MSIRRAALPALLLAAAAAVLGSVAPARSDAAYTPLPQAQAYADIHTGIGTGDGSTTYPDSGTAPEVDPATIAAEDGVTLSTVEGVACVPGPGVNCPYALAAATTSDVHCWRFDNPGRLATHWGTIPYMVNVYETRRWCAHKGGNITYISSHVHAYSKYLCDAQNPSDQWAAGGVGYRETTRETGANFSCPILGFIPLNIRRWQRWATNSYGGYWLVSRSGNL